MVAQNVSLRKRQYQDFLGSGDSQSTISSSHGLESLRGRGNQTELDELVEIIDSLDELDHQTKRQLKKDLKLINRWAPTFAKLGYLYSIMAEFGVQMVITLVLAFVIVGIMGAKFVVLFFAAYLLLLIASGLRYRFLLGILKRTAIYSRMFNPDISDFINSQEAQQHLRQEFAKIVGIQSLSLLAVLFFAMRILGERSEVFGVKLIDMFLLFVTDILGDVLPNLFLFVIGGALSLIGARKSRSLQRYEGT